MQNWLLLLILAVCPLMMYFMMRGMHSGRSDQTGDEIAPNHLAQGEGSDARDARLAELEREVADLRAAGDPR